MTVILKTNLLVYIDDGPSDPKKEGNNVQDEDWLSPKIRCREEKEGQKHRDSDRAHSGTNHEED